MWEETLIFVLIYLGVFFILPDKVRNRILTNKLMGLTVIAGLVFGVFSLYRARRENFQTAGCGTSGIDCSDQDPAKPFCLINERSVPTADIDQTVAMNLYGRYIRLYPSATNGDGYSGISQVVVTDATGTNISAGKTVTATSTYAGVLAATSVIDGTMSARKWPNLWNNNGSRSDYLQIDLGSVLMIATVRVIFRGDYGDTAGIKARGDTDRTTGTRIVVLQTPTDTVSTTGTCVATPTITYPSGTTIAEQAVIGPMILKGMNGAIALNLYRGLAGAPPSTFTSFGLTDSQSAEASLKIYTDNLLSARLAGTLTDSSYYSATNAVKTVKTMAGVTGSGINVSNELQKYMTAHEKKTPSVSGTTVTLVGDGGKEQAVNEIMTVLMPKAIDPSAGYSASTTQNSNTNIPTPPNTASWSQTALATAPQQPVPITMPSDNSGKSSTGAQIDTSGLGSLAAMFGYSSPASSQTGPQWYFVTANTASANAATQCANFGGKIATLDQITDAQKNGAYVNQWGWYADTMTGAVVTTTVAYPRDQVVTSAASLQAANTIGVNCFGNRPPKGTTNVAPWTDTAHVANSSSYVANDWSKRIGGDGGNLKSSDGTLLIPGTPLKTQEVYWVGFKNSDAHTKADAQAICVAAGGDLATISQLQAAQGSGAQWCHAGWLKDSATPKWPMQQTAGGCGIAGLNDFGSTQTSGANCVGMKPSQSPDMLTLPNGNTTQTLTVKKTGRYVRVRGSLTSGDGWFHFSQIAVKDSNGNTISKGKPTYYNAPPTTSPAYWGSGTVSSIAVDGTEAVRNWDSGGVFHSFNSSKTDDSQYWEVDLGADQMIDSIVFYGRGDCCYGGSGTDRITGLRFEISHTPVPMPFSTYSAPSSWSQSTYVNTNKCANNTTPTVCNNQSVCLPTGQTCSTCSGTMKTYNGLSVCNNGETQPQLFCPVGTSMTVCNNTMACVPANGDCNGAIIPRSYALDKVPSDMTTKDFIEKCNITMSNINTLTQQYNTPLTINRASWPPQPVNTFAIPAIQYTSSTSGATKQTCCYGGTPVVRNVYLTGLNGTYPDNKSNGFIASVANLTTKPFSDFTTPYNKFYADQARLVAVFGGGYLPQFFNGNTNPFPFDITYMCPGPSGTACYGPSGPDDQLCLSGTCNPTTYLCQCSTTKDCEQVGGTCINNSCMKAIGSGCTLNTQCISGSCFSGTCKNIFGKSCSANGDCTSNNCVNGTCAAANNGGTCAVNSDCVNGLCWQNNICGFASNQMCSNNSNCASNNCVSVLAGFMHVCA